MTQASETEASVGRGSPSPFWRFSLSVYGRKGVPPACLALQDESGVDVNVLLFSLYLGTRGRALSVDEVRGIADLVDPWKSGIVVALRTARRNLKEPAAPFEGPSIEALRKAVKAAELEAERIQQETLFVSFPAETVGQTAAVAAEACAGNVEAYRGVLGTTFDAASVSTLLEAVASATATPL